MNSDKAAAVRDSINGCPTVIDEDAVVERDRSPSTTHRGRTLTGDRTTTERYHYRPAYIKQSGTLGDGTGATRPVYVVVVEPLWCESSDARSLPPELVYEVAKHDCALRFYPPEHRFGGAFWVVDHFTEDLSHSDGDRCPECESTYFKLDDGTPTCARCGTPANGGETARQTTLADGIDS